MILKRVVGIVGCFVALTVSTSHPERHLGSQIDPIVEADDGEFETVWCSFQQDLRAFEQKHSLRYRCYGFAAPKLPLESERPRTWKITALLRAVSGEDWYYTFEYRKSGRQWVLVRAYRGVDEPDDFRPHKATEG